MVKGVSSLKAHPPPSLPTTRPPTRQDFVLLPKADTGFGRGRKETSEGARRGVTQDTRPSWLPWRSQGLIGLCGFVSCSVDKICLHDRHAQPAWLVTKLDMRETEEQCHSSAAQSRMPWEEPHLGHSQVRWSRRPPELPLTQE